MEVSPVHRNVELITMRISGYLEEENQRVLISEKDIESNVAFIYPYGRVVEILSLIGGTLRNL